MFRAMRPWVANRNGSNRIDMRVLVCAGGTGGGIYPALAVVTELRTCGVKTDDILWIGTKGEMEEQLVPRAGLRLETIAGGPIVSVPLATRARNAIKLARSVGTASDLIRRFQPHVLFTTGAYVAAPVTLAARRHRLPIVIFLPDIEPGTTIRFTVPFARKIACTTSQSQRFVPAEKMVITGYPVRSEIRAAKQLTKEEALTVFDLQPGRPTLFVFGGSRGARAINRALMAILPTILNQAQIIHVSGHLTWPEVEANAATLSPDLRAYYRPYPYLHDQMGAGFRAADLVVARSGASMMGECPAFGVPSILVPLTFAWRYQKVNADYLTESGAAVQLTDETLADSLLATIQDLLFDPPRLQAMGKAAAALDRPEAALDLARLVMAVAKLNGQENASVSRQEASC